MMFCFLLGFKIPKVKFNENVDVFHYSKNVENPAINKTLYTYQNPKYEILLQEKYKNMLQDIKIKQNSVKQNSFRNTNSKRYFEDGKLLQNFSNENIYDEKAISANINEKNMFHQSTEKYKNQTDIDRQINYDSKSNDEMDYNLLLDKYMGCVNKILKNPLKNYWADRKVDTIKQSNENEHLNSWMLTDSMIEKWRMNGSRGMVEKWKRMRKEKYKEFISNEVFNIICRKVVYSTNLY